MSEKRIPIMLCGNKLDLRSDLLEQGRRCVTSENGEKLAREHSATFLETSSKDGDNVLDALVQLSRLILFNLPIQKDFVKLNYSRIIQRRQKLIKYRNNSISRKKICLRL